MSAATPIISVSFDADEGTHTLQATSYGRTSPAGPRLFRAPPHPAIAFSHATSEQAEKDAATLREYLEGLAARKGPSKAKLRKLGAD